MSRDVLYYYDKVGSDSGKGLFPINSYHELGEIQADFEMSMVIDGTKDSMKVQVLSFVDAPITPLTIVRHPKTNTWWVVDDDKIQRFEHEGNPYWLHTISLLGAIELLGYRDLTDCGFTDNRYTVAQILNRLVSLSNFEYQGVFRSNVLDPNTKVDHLKTFENYTLLSAIREILDAYNCVAKLSFGLINVSPQRYGAIINIVSKTGDINRTHTDSIFNSVNETRTMNKDSHGSIVVSNAQNVAGIKAKTYPSIGAVALSSKEYLVSPGTQRSGNSPAIIRLPSPAYKVNWVRMFNTQAPIQLYFKYKESGVESQAYNSHYTINTTDISKCWSAFNEIVADLIQYENDYLQENHELSDNLKASFTKDTWYQKILDLMCPIFYECNVKYNPSEQDGIGEYDDDPSGLFTTDSGLPLQRFKAMSTTKYWVLGRKSLHDGVNWQYQVMYWEQGSDLIENFNYFASNNYSGTYDYDRTIRKQYSNPIYLAQGTIDYGINNSGWFNILPYNQENSGDSIFWQFNQTAWQVNYIPMNDIKIKLENSNGKQDTQYYNQNGKLTDSNALSKLLVSYGKEITSTTITRRGVFYDFDDIPKVGDIVNIGSKSYVITNISYAFKQNEEYEYAIYCDFTMSLYTATKSLMVNPNTSIRDYDIPQSNNIKRKQVYKDVYEFSLTHDNDNVAPYMFINNYLNFYTNNNMAGITYLNSDANHVGLVKVVFANSQTWWYQLETSVYNLKKSVYEVVDFKDNNIIGYGVCNTSGGFDISKIIAGNTVLPNTPISYVDANGEIKDIYIKFVDSEQLNYTWEEYRAEHSISSNVSLINCSVLVNDEVYDNATADFIIEEESYRKDATEVPVFEYACEVKDNFEVIVGDNVLNYLESDIMYLYGFKAVPKGTNNDNFVGIELSPINIQGTINNACVMQFVKDSDTNTHISLCFLTNVRANESLTGYDYYYSQGITDLSDILNPETQDLMIYRRTITPETTMSGSVDYYHNTRDELMFIIKGENLTNDLLHSYNLWDGDGNTVSTKAIYLYANNKKTR